MRLRHLSRMQHGGKNDCEVFTLSLRGKLTGDPVEVAARPVPVFKPSKELRAMVADASEKVSS